MTTTLKIAQVEGGAGGNGLMVDTVASVTLADTRIRLYTFAVTVASEIVIGDKKPGGGGRGPPNPPITSFSLNIL